MDTSKTLVCRLCNCVPEIVRKEGNSDMIRCPSCGVSCGHKEATKRAGEYISRSTQNSIFSGFQRGQISSTKRLKNVTYRPGKLPRISKPDFIFR